MINNAILGVIAGARIAAPAGPAVTWDPVVIGRATLSNGNLTAVALGTAGDKYGNVQATIGYGTGKWYFEVVIDTAATFLPTIGVGIYRALSSTTDTELGSSNAVSLRINGGKYDDGSYNGSFTSAFGAGSVVMCAFDAGTRNVWLGVDGTWRGSGSPDPATATAPAGAVGSSGDLYPGVSTGISDYAGVVTGRFKASAFSYSIPSGFSAVDPNP